MKDNIKKPNFYENDDINKSKHKKEIQTSSSSITYQILFNENNKFNKKLKTGKCITKKKLLIIGIIIIAIILFLILFIIAKLYCSPKKKVIFPKNPIKEKEITNNNYNYNFYNFIYNCYPIFFLHKKKKCCRKKYFT